MTKKAEIKKEFTSPVHIKLFNRTVSQIEFKGKRGSLTLDAAPDENSEGPALDVTKNFNGILVMSDCSEQLHALLSAGSIRMDPPDQPIVE
jgi:hypothetical protein